MTSKWRGIKALPLDRWMRDPDQATLQGYVEVEPVFNRDGRYCGTEAAWFEVNGKAYREPRIDDFLYRLHMLDERRLHPKALQAMQYLAYASSDSVIRQRCWKHLRDHENAEALRRIELAAGRHHLRRRKEKS